MSTSRTPCPKYDQCINVSYTERPVTHVAEVAVKSASTGFVNRPLFAEIGSVSNTVPIKISIKKLTTNMRVGDVRFTIFCNLEQIYANMSSLIFVRRSAIISGTPST